MRWASVLAAVAAIGIAGCGSVPAQQAAGSASPAASTTARSVSSFSAFAATSVTWVSPDEAFVLGTAPCAHAPCTSIARTLDRGASWAGMPAPVVPLGDPYDYTG